MSIRLLLTFSFLLFVAAGAHADSPDSFLLQPNSGFLAYYKQDLETLSKKRKMAVRIHGLRGTPLHPAVWGALKADRTRNRNLVPIRAYYLRESEQPGFEISKMSFRFRFKKASAHDMKVSPHTKDPVFDIGFAGEYVPDLRVRRPKIDRSYVVRFAAFKALESGIFFRSHSKFTKLRAGWVPRLDIATEYHAELRFSSDKVEVLLDGTPFTEVSGTNLNRGLISLINSWHPVIISDLQIEGTRGSGSERKQLAISGLVGLNG